MSNTGVIKMKLMRGCAEPVMWVNMKSYRKIARYMKVDKLGRVTVNKSKVRELHGNSLIKKIYKHGKKSS